MKQITWQLVRGLGRSSKLIGWFGAGFYSHIDVITPAGMLRGARSDWLKGIEPGVQDRPQEYEHWEAATRYTLDVAEDQYVKYWDYSDKQMGKPYDPRGLVDTFVFGRDWRDDGQWWCSELVAMTGEVAGMWTIDRHTRSVEPKDCAMLFMGGNALRKEMVCS